jgi:TFIIF-interacting CTD phosphatase-like protein
MINKVGAFIIYDNETYPYVLNKEYFKMHKQIKTQNTLYSNRNVLFLKSDLPYSDVEDCGHAVTTALYEKCIFVYEGEEEKYAEYLI